MRASEWLKVEVPVQSRNLTIHGARVKVLPSPYDIPTDVRMLCDKVRKLLIMEFRYIADEELSLRELSDDVRVLLGGKSGRIHRIEVPNGKISARKAIEAFDAALKRLMATERDDDRVRENALIAEEVVKSSKHRLEGAACG